MGEACDGHRSPLDNKFSSTGKRNRKRRRVSHMTPMGPIDGNNSNKNRKRVVTPGLTRAAKNAEEDLIGSFESIDEEMKDAESESLESTVSTETPGNFEGPVQFSGMDLNKGMIEIQNTGKSAIPMAGYVLSNALGTNQFTLPKDATLKQYEKLRVYVVGDYKGATVFWTKDVWTADVSDYVRLYNPDCVE